MHRIIIDQPYIFIAPRFSRFWLRVTRCMLPRSLRKEYGISSVECVGTEKLSASIAAGHGIMIVPNHCRPCDPMIIDSLAAAVRRPFHVIASWHVFMNSRVQRFLLPRLGGFSIYREGLDRESLKCAIKTLAEAKFPLVVFAEGIITRCNDRLVTFMEGPSFIARAAAKQHPCGKSVIHPVFIRYFFEGNLEESIIPVIEKIERRLSWQPQIQLGLQDRIAKIGEALLSLKEIEYLESAQFGNFVERLHRLQGHLLAPLEDHWCGGRHDGDPMARVKRLRTAILPDIVSGDIADEDRAARWRDLADLYLVQQLHCYPGDYIEYPTPERILETVERYEEDLTDLAHPHFPLRAVVCVGDAIEVGTERGITDEGDAVTAALRRSIVEMMESSRSLRRIPATGNPIS